MTSATSGALFAIGLRYTELREEAAEVLFAHIHAAVHISSRYAQLLSKHDGLENANFGTDNLLGIYRLSVCVLSFLEVAAQNAPFWSPDQQLRIVSAYDMVLSHDLLLVTEAAYSMLRNQSMNHPEINIWKTLQRQHAARGHPLGAISLRLTYMAFNEACAATLTVLPVGPSLHGTLTALVFHSGTLRGPMADDQLALAEKVAGIAAEEINRLDEGSDYLRLESAWQQRSAQALKASAISSYLLCSLNINDDGDNSMLLDWLEGVLADPLEVSDEALACTALRCLSVMARTSTTVASKLARSLPRFLSSRSLLVTVASVAAESLVCALKVTPHDTVITTLYGLGNSLSSKTGVEASANYNLFNDVSAENQHVNSRLFNNQSTVSIVLQDGDDPSTIYNAVVLAIVQIAKGFGDETISGLALSILVQKVGRLSRAVDMTIVTQVAAVAVDLSIQDFKALLRLYVRITADGMKQNDDSMIEAVSEARDYLSRTLKSGTPLYDAYLEHLLETLIGQGEGHTSEQGRIPDKLTSTREMACLFRPLAILFALNPTPLNPAEAGRLPSLQRDAWYNIAVHGFSTLSIQGKPYLQDLQVFAQYTYPLVAAERADRLESDIDLNTVLRRGKSSPGASDREKETARLLPRSASDIGSLNYPELMFLRASHLLETLRARSGDCTKTLTYFVDPQLRSGGMGACMTALAIDCVDSYLSGGAETLSAPYVAKQMSSTFEACCHRIGAVQKAAYTCVERMIRQVPSALCHKTAIFTLLDLLTIMWTSCLAAETDEYDWKSTYIAPKGRVSLQLSDDFEFRRLTLRTFHSHARRWVTEAMGLAPLDIKGLLQVSNRCSLQNFLLTDCTDLLVRLR